MDSKLVWLAVAGIGAWALGLFGRRGGRRKGRSKGRWGRRSMTPVVIHAGGGKVRRGRR